MKKTLCLVLLLAAALAVTGTAQATPDVGGPSYDLEDGVLTISGEGDMEDFEKPSDSPWYGSRTSIVSVVIGDGVTSIGKNAFNQCVAIKSVSLPSTVKTIGDKAFYNCSSLEEIDLSSVETIGGSAFNLCRNLTSADLSSLRISGASAFSACFSLYTVTIGDSLYSLESKMFYRCTALTDIGLGSIVLINEGTFQNCTTLRSIALPSTVVEIGYKAFQGCTSLESLTVPDSVKAIRSMAFQGCTGLAYVSLPASLTNVDGAAFSACTSLNTFDGDYGGNLGSLLINPEGNMVVSCAAGPEVESVTVPDNVAYIGNYAFQGCASLKTVVAEHVEITGVYSFQDCISLENVYLGGVSEIRQYSFYNCVSLTNIVISEDLKDIGYFAFDNSAIPSFTIPEGVTEIKNSTFRECKDLEYIDIPDGVTSIGARAFSGCTSLKGISIPASVSKINTNSFEGFTFYAEDGTVLTVEELPGHTFANDGNGNMYLQEHLFEQVCVEPTCTEKGYEGYVCRICGESHLTETEALGHEFISLYSTVDTHLCDRCTFGWSFSHKTLTLTVGGEGSTGDYTYSYLTPWKQIREQVKTLVVEDGVTAIGKKAFIGCSNLETVIISDSVTSIGYWAFGGISTIKTLEIGSGLTEVGRLAFDGMTFVGPDGEAVDPSAGYLKGSTFLGTDGSLSIESSSGTYGSIVWTFDGTTGTLLLEGKGSTGDFEYTYLTPWRQIRDHVTEIIVGPGITEIGKKAFLGFTNLESVTIADTVTMLGQWAFGSDSSITYLKVGDGLTKVRYKAFDGLTFVGPDGEAVEPDAGFLRGNTFTGTEGTLSLNTTNGTLGSVTWLFDGTTGTLTIGGEGPMPSLEKNSRYPWFAYRPYITSVVVEDGVTYIGSYAFRNYAALESVTISDTVKTIAKCAFYDDANLTYLEIGGGLVKEGYRVFGKVPLAMPDGTLIDVKASHRGMTFDRTGDGLTLTRVETSGDGVGWTLDVPSGTLVLTGGGDMASHVAASQYSWYAYKAYVKHLTVGDGVESVGAYAFKGYTHLESVEFSDSVRTICKYAFDGDASIVHVEFGNGLETFSGCAFGQSFHRNAGAGKTTNPDTLKGHTFEGHDGKLVRVA